MLEYWCWTPAVLRTLGQHFSYISPECFEVWKNQASSVGSERPEERLSEDVIYALVAAKNVNAAHFYLNQLRLSMFDLIIHSPSSNEKLQAMNVSAVYNEIRSTVFPPRGPEAFGEGFEWGHGQTFNRHAM
jgi:metallopeptidase MepB